MLDPNRKGPNQDRHVMEARVAPQRESRPRKLDPPKPYLENNDPNFELDSECIDAPSLFLAFRRLGLDDEQERVGVGANVPAPPNDPKPYCDWR